MTAHGGKEMERAIGRAPEQLTLTERHKLAGLCIALEIYTPEDLPLRRIEAIGENIGDCVRMLKSRGLDPARFEYSRLAQPY
jgi:hypothetical protein